jgi:hypothetical protein
MQFEFREVIDASPARGFETIGNGFGDVSTWSGSVALSIWNGDNR